MTKVQKSVGHLKAHGRYPRFVYRAFTEKTYAEEFAHGGKFRMGNLNVYSSLEDSERGDPFEGEGHFRRFGTVTSVDFVLRSEETFVSVAPGYVDTHTELLNPKFLLSCSQPGVDLDYVRSRFGRWVIRIDNPRRLAQEVSSYLEDRRDRFTGVEGCVVHYSKGGQVRATLSNVTWTRLSYTQKPEVYCSEKEFRLVVIAMGKPSTWFDADYLPVDLGHALDYVTVI